MKSITTSFLLATTLSHIAIVDAFTPSSFTPSTHKVVIKTQQFHKSNHGSSSSTGLQMNLFDRFSRVAKANLNNVLKTLEDPEKILNQAVEDMQVR